MNAGLAAITTLVMTAIAVTSATAAQVVSPPADISLDVDTTPTMTAATLPAHAIPVSKTKPDVTIALGDTDRLNIASSHLLNNPAALINKNTLATDNNVVITSSNIAFMQDDEVKIKRIVDKLVADAAKIDLDADVKVDAAVDVKKQEMDTAVLARDLLRAISAPDQDQALLTKASAVITSAQTQMKRQDTDTDQIALDNTIADLIRAILDHKRARTQQQQQPLVHIDTVHSAQAEAAVQTDIPRGVILLLGTKDILRQPSAVVNKNVVMADSQFAISRSQLAPQSKDTVSMSDDAKLADAIASGSAIKMEDPDMFRVGFLYQKKTEPQATVATAQDTNTEQFGFYRGGMGFGWRYPLPYWTRYGRFLYPGACGVGVPLGRFFYC